MMGEQGELMMAKGKPHIEFTALDMDAGWEVPAGYPDGIQQKVLTSDLDETAKAGILSRNALAFYRIDEKRGAKAAEGSTISAGE